MQSIKVSNNLVSKVSEKLGEAKINTKKPQPTNKKPIKQSSNKCMKLKVKAYLKVKHQFPEGQNLTMSRRNNKAFRCTRPLSA